ncbi:DUF4097 family beta strand repeat-containing protein [Staphylococcus pasteuri]|uniref:DUF4097 family beta strand repeat-containing protein n=6 Tax=Staphylococcus pasteuri TaxID=45972 RepID=UPI0019074FC6|nr:DUF4097 family beta strand repeat-containing protein [Staphylococcus pasteuri]QQN54877.1 DUF4097 family beta strand repeat protein [Staphylococcus pasteuri]
MRKLMFSGLIIFIVFFIGATITWFAFEKQNYEEKKFNETYPNYNFKNISIKSEYANVKLVKGPKFKVKYNGDSNVKVNKNKENLKVTEKKNVNRGYAINLNPFRKRDNLIVIEVPNKKLNTLSVDSINGNYFIEDIKVKKSLINNNYGQIFINKSEFNDSDIKAKNLDFSMNNSKIKDTHINIDKGEINTRHNKINNSIFLLNQGDINFKNMPSESDIKASTKDGNISFKYKDTPQDTLLKLKPSKGQSLIKNKNFHESKVGKSNNVLEFYTVDGDITIK